MCPFDRELVMGEPGEESFQVVEMSGLYCEVVSGELPSPRRAVGGDRHQVAEQPDHHGEDRDARRALDDGALPGPGRDGQRPDPPSEPDQHHAAGRLSHAVYVDRASVQPNKVEKLTYFLARTREVSPSSARAKVQELAEISTTRVDPECYVPPRPGSPVRRAAWRRRARTGTTLYGRTPP